MCLVVAEDIGPYSIFRNVNTTWTLKDVISLVETEVAMVAETGWQKSFYIHLGPGQRGHGMVDG